MRRVLVIAVLVAAGLVFSAPARASGTRTLSFDVLPNLGALAPSGAPAPDQPLTIGLALNAPDQAARDAYVHAVYDPTSPLYHRFLTPAEIAARFGVDQATFDRVRSWLTAGGFTITHTAAARDYVLADGTVRAAQHLFGTTLKTFQYQGSSFMANVVPPTVPDDLPIATVLGLNDRQQFHPFAHPQVSPNDNLGLMTPQDLWSIYEQPADNTGQGQTMAVFGEGATDSVIQDLRTFETEFGLPQIPVQVKHVGSGPFDDTSGNEEWDIDTQASTGMAPNALREDLYFTKSLSDADVMAEMSAWVSDPEGPLQANASFGECETMPLNPVFGNPALQPATPPTQGIGDNFEPVGEGILQQAALEGRTLFSSTGDTGSSCPVVIVPVIGAGNGILNQGYPLLSYPAASKYAVAVGGTVLYSDGGQPAQRSLEYAWTFTGGGTSVFIDQPDYQAGTAHLVGRCLTDPSGQSTNTGQPCRGIPDVAAISGDVTGNGYATVMDGAKDQPGGGTSLSSPLWVGMWTRVQAAAGPGGNGFANPSLYRLGNDPATAADSFTDVTVGTNGLYTALPGWDYTSGFGTPRLTNLMTHLDGTTTPTNDVVPPPPPSPPVIDPCAPAWTDPAGDDAFAVDGQSHSDLDVIDGSFALSPDGQTLVVTLHVADLSGAVPAPGASDDYYMTWTAGNVASFAHASIAAVTGQATFSDGQVQVVGTTRQYNDANTVTGRVVDGSPGTIEIDVPVADIGHPAAGSVLTQPVGETYVAVGVPGAAESLQPDDTGGPQHDYQLGQVCTG